MSKDGPIGIFDSGIGGLTVAKAIHNELPNEDIVYFGDTAHFPYGDKEPQSIITYAEKITEFLIEQNCKAIVIACNTASAISFDFLKGKFGERIPFFDVISPVALHFKQSEAKRVGVIATKGTVGSGVYVNSIHAVNPEIQVQSLATPLLAPMIEEGFFNDSISATVINEYLSDAILKDIESIILGCTHYPIIQKEVEAFFKQGNHKVEVLNSAQLVAKAVKAALKSKRLLTTNKTKKVEQHFYVSDFTTSFEKSTKIFFGDLLRLEKMNLWKV